MKTVKMIRTTSVSGKTVRKDEIAEVSDIDAHRLVCYGAAVIADVVGKRQPKQKE